VPGGGDEDVVADQDEIVDVQRAGKEHAPVRHEERAIRPHQVGGHDLSRVVGIAEHPEEEDLVRRARAADDQLASPLVVEQPGRMGQIHRRLPWPAAVASEQHEQVLVLARDGERDVELGEDVPPRAARLEAEQRLRVAGRDRRERDVPDLVRVSSAHGLNSNRRATSPPASPPR
jgi:hypothetical protein